MGRNTLLAAFASGAEWQRCLACLWLGPSDIISFNSALRALERGRCWDHALSLLRHMQSGTRPNLVSYNTLMSAFVETRGARPGWKGAISMQEMNGGMS